MASSTVRLTVAQAIVRFLSVQYSERDGQRQRLIPAVHGIFGHGNVAGLGQAILQNQQAPAEGEEPLVYYQGRNEQNMVHAAVSYARTKNRLQAHAVTASFCSRRTFSPPAGWIPCSSSSKTNVATTFR